MMYNAPHTPLQAPDEAVQPYLDAGLSPGVAITYAMNEIMDRGVRRITETLDALGLADDTILMFTSDNGPAFATRPDQVPAGMSPDLYHTRRYNCGFNGQKGSVYEGGIRVPMIMRWRGGLEGGRQVDELVHGMDWLPTLAGLCGVERPGGRPLDGRDAAALLRGAGDDAPARFWQLNQFQPVGWYQRGDARGTVEAGASPLGAAAQKRCGQTRDGALRGVGYQIQIPPRRGDGTNARAGSRADYPATGRLGVIQF